MNEIQSCVEIEYKENFTNERNFLLVTLFRFIGTNDVGGLSSHVERLILSAMGLIRICLLA